MKPKEENILKALGLRIKALRNERTISQQELADEADITQAYLSNIESGQVNPSATVLYFIAQALQVPISELMNFKVSDK